MKIEKLTYINEEGESVVFSHKSIYHVNQVSGLSGIRNAIYSVNSMGQDGDTYLGGRIESRDIEIIGSINTRKKEEALEHRRRLNRILNPKFSATLIYEFGDFKRIIDCKVNADTFQRQAVFQDFTIQLICHNPFWREEFEDKVDIAAWIGGLEYILEIPEETGMQMGYREPSLIVNVYNAGDVQSGIRVEFRAVGTIKNPSILNVETQEFIKFNNLTMTAGDILTISTYYGKKEVTLLRDGVLADAFRYLDVDSTYIQLDVGDNLFRYDAESNRDGVEVSIYHDNNFLGV